MVYIFLAEGFEEIEALTQIDLLRRADVDVTSVGIGNTVVTGAHGIEVNCNIDISRVNIENADMLILPGGMPGVTNLYDNMSIRELILKAVEKEISRYSAGAVGQLV